MKNNVFEKFSGMDNLKNDIMVKTNQIIKKSHESSNSNNKAKFHIVDVKLVTNKKDKGEKNE